MKLLIMIIAAFSVLFLGACGEEECESVADTGDMDCVSDDDDSSGDDDDSASGQEEE